MKNYFSYSFYLTASVVVLMSIVSLVVPGQAFGFKLKQTNIYSDLVADTAIRELVGLEGSPFVHQKASVAMLDRAVEENFELIETLKQATAEAQEVARRATKPVPKGVVALEDFSASGYHLEPFFKSLNNSANENVRIAVLGDSFIEGDIMTVDMRELFQNQNHGAGVGFMPITSVVAKFRGSVAHRFSDNWRDYTILKDQSSAKFMLSGHSFTAKGDRAWVEYQGNKYRKHLDVFDRATFLFINNGNTTISVSVNGQPATEFTPESSPEMQSVTVRDSIHKVRFEISGSAGFSAYGALLDNPAGVSVDNYSVRGNSGIGMVAINGELCAQMSRVAPYDLIILEYGLNVVEEGVTSYGNYRNQMIRVVEHLKTIYPDVPIILMGVSDRSTMLNGEFVTMEGVKGMDAAQRDVARKCGIAYWSTLNAMRSLGGMPKFVENGWAAKDYTHIGATGGKKIGLKLYEAIMANR